MQPQLVERELGDLRDRAGRKPAAVDAFGDPVTEVGALERAAEDVREDHRPGDALPVEDRKDRLVVLFDALELTLEGVEALAARGLVRSEELAVLEQERQEPAGVVGGEQTNRRGPTVRRRAGSAPPRAAQRRR